LGRLLDQPLVLEGGEDPVDCAATRADRARQVCERGLTTLRDQEEEVRRPFDCDGRAVGPLLRLSTHGTEFRTAFEFSQNRACSIRARHAEYMLADVGKDEIVRYGG